MVRCLARGIRRRSVAGKIRLWSIPFREGEPTVDAVEDATLLSGTKLLYLEGGVIGIDGAGHSKA